MPRAFRICGRFFRGTKIHKIRLGRTVSEGDLEHHTILLFTIFPIFCCEKQSLADQKMKIGVQASVEIRKIKKKFLMILKIFSEFLNFSEFFLVLALHLYSSIHFLIGPHEYILWKFHVFFKLLFSWIKWKENDFLCRRLFLVYDKFLKHSDGIIPKFL